MCDAGLKFFRTNDREDEVGDQAEGDDSDDGVFHMGLRLDLLAGPDEEEHEPEEADGSGEIKDVSHNDTVVVCIFDEEGCREGRQADGRRHCGWYCWFPQSRVLMGWTTDTRQ